MSIKLDSRHLYLRVIEIIKNDIESGVYQENEKLPSEFELSKIIGVSRATLREALRILEEDGVVRRRHGIGTFVNKKPIYSSGIEQLSSITDMIQQSGKQPGTKYLSTEIIEPTSEQKRLFQKNLEKLVEIERIRTADNQPVVLCVDYIPKEIIPLDLIPKSESIFKLLEKSVGKKVGYAVTYIEPVNYHERIYSILACDPEQPLLLLKQMHYTDADEPVLYSANYFRSDVFSFHVLRKRLQ